MAFEKAVQSLSSLEEKLRRAFNLAGVIGARLKPDLVTPVVLVQDVTQPGYATDKGRCWAWASLTPGGGAGISVVVLAPQVDVLVEGFYITGTLGASQPFDVYVTAPNEALPAAAATPSGGWRDRKMFGADVPPLFDSGAGFVALTGTAITATNRIAAWNGGAGGTSEGTVREIPVMIPAGGSLTFRSAAVNNVRCGAWGRIWP